MAAAALHAGSQSAQIGALLRDLVDGENRSIRRAAVPQTDFADVVRSAALQPGRKDGRSGFGRRGGNGRLNRRIGTALNRAEKIVGRDDGRGGFRTAGV